MLVVYRYINRSQKKTAFSTIQQVAAAKLKAERTAGADLLAIICYSYFRILFRNNFSAIIIF